MFVTLLGYPTTCTHGHVSHACTISLACWMAGGTSEPGCGASPWLVACCVTKSKNNKHQQHQYIKQHVQKQQQDKQQLLFHQEFTSELNALQLQGGFETLEFSNKTICFFSVWLKLFFVEFYKSVSYMLIICFNFINLIAYIHNLRFV